MKIKLLSILLLSVFVHASTMAEESVKDYVNNGTLKMTTDDYKGAIEYFNKAIDSRP